MKSPLVLACLFAAITLSAQITDAQVQANALPELKLVLFEHYSAKSFADIIQTLYGERGAVAVEEVNGIIAVADAASIIELAKQLDEAAKQKKEKESVSAVPAPAITKEISPEKAAEMEKELELEREFRKDIARCEHTYKDIVVPEYVDPYKVGKFLQRTFSVPCHFLPEKTAIRVFCSHTLKRVDGQTQLENYIINLNDGLTSAQCRMMDFLITTMTRDEKSAAEYGVLKAKE